jgi:hypothetical protein
MVLSSIELETVRVSMDSYSVPWTLRPLIVPNSRSLYRLASRYNASLEKKLMTVTLLAAIQNEIKHSDMFQKRFNSS